MQEYNGEQKPKLQNGISVLCHLYSFKTLKTILCIDYGYMHILKSVKPCMIILNTKFKIVITIGKATIEDVEWDQVVVPSGLQLRAKYFITLKSEAKMANV